MKNSPTHKFRDTRRPREKEEYGANNCIKIFDMVHPKNAMRVLLCNINHASLHNKKTSNGYTKNKYPIRT